MKLRCFSTLMFISSVEASICHHCRRHQGWHRECASTQSSKEEAENLAPKWSQHDPDGHRSAARGQTVSDHVPLHCGAKEVIAEQFLDNLKIADQAYEIVGAAWGEGMNLIQPKHTTVSCQKTRR